MMVYNYIIHKVARLVCSVVRRCTVTTPLLSLQTNAEIRSVANSQLGVGLLLNDF